MSRPDSHIYNIETGVIRTTLNADARTVCMNTGPGEAIYIGDVNPAKQIIRHGIAVDAPVQEAPKAPPVNRFTYANFLDALATDKLDAFVKALKESRK